MSPEMPILDMFIKVVDDLRGGSQIGAQIIGKIGKIWLHSKLFLLNIIYAIYIIANLRFFF